ncbi:MAG: energy transducer TonB [Acidobacteriales bacterium]|nr:energy transducer TonB [Terriglobales bacterium]
MPTEDESQRELYPERRLRPPLLPAAPDPEVQRKRMLMALGVLLVALVAVVLKDWDFWFPPNEEVQDTSAPRRKSGAALAAAPASAAAANKSERKSAKAPEPTAAGAPFAATTERAALPPLQVEVVAGNRRTRVPARNSAIHLDMNSGAASPASEAPAVRQETVVSAADRVQLSPQTAQNVTVSVPPDYPLLARQMKVQGAVILQALISREGAIQELQIVSGPGILATAAREAVKQWRFKPYYQSGQPVETQARITVNFTISTN